MYQITNINGMCEIMLYSDIDRYGMGISANDIISQIKSAGENVSIITLRINSEGGDVFEALAMYNYLKQHRAKVRVYIDGLCASAASVVMCAGDKVYMPSNALIMIHNPMSYAAGDSEELREMASILDKIRENIINVYVGKSNLGHDEIAALMDAETWINATDAQSYGFIDEILEARNIAERPNIDAAVNQERKRIQELDALKAPGYEDIITDAKYVSIRNAKDVAYEIVTSGKLAHSAVTDLTPAKVSSVVHESIDRLAGIINKKRGY